MTSVLSTLNPLFEKNQTLTKSIYTSFNRSTREGVKKDSANSLVNTDETESLHYNNDNLVFDSTSGPSTVIISSEGNITAKGNLTIGGVFNGTCTNATNAINADHAKTAANANIANDLTDDAKAALQTSFDGRYLQSVPDTLTLEDLSVVNPINGSIERADTSATADVAKGFTTGAKLALQLDFDSRYLQSVPDPLTLANCEVTDQMVAQSITVDGRLYARNTIEGNVQTAETAKALTDDCKTALQNDFDSRYVLQTSTPDSAYKSNTYDASSFNYVNVDLSSITDMVLNLKNSSGEYIYLSTPTHVYSEGYTEAGIKGTIALRSPSIHFKDVKFKMEIYVLKKGNYSLLCKREFLVSDYVGTGEVDSAKGTIALFPIDMAIGLDSTYRDFYFLFSVSSADTTKSGTVQVRACGYTSKIITYLSK